MIMSKLGALNTEVARTGVVVPAESSQPAIQSLSELDILALATKPPPAQPLEISPKPAEPSVREKTVLFYSEGRTMERWNILISSLPLSLVLGLGYYLLFLGTPQWLAGVIMLAGLIVFALTGCLIERQRLQAFVCPRCQAPIEDWETNENNRVLTNCARCGSSWDIEYKLRPGSEPIPPLVERHARAARNFSALCSPIGGH